MDVAFMPMSRTLATPSLTPGGYFAPGACEVSVASAVSQTGASYWSPRTASGTAQLVGGDVPSAWRIPREVGGSGWGWEGFAVG